MTPSPITKMIADLEEQERQNRLKAIWQPPQFPILPQKNVLSQMQAPLVQSQINTLPPMNVPPPAPIQYTMQLERQKPTQMFRPISPPLQDRYYLVFFYCIDEATCKNIDDHTGMWRKSKNSASSVKKPMYQNPFLECFLCL
jgi:hypothetical protein